MLFYSTLASSQRTHIFASFIAFVKLEIRRLKEHISWYEQKAVFSRQGVTNYLRAISFILLSFFYF
jgi:hypothetical protein